MNYIYFSFTFFGLIAISIGVLSGFHLNEGRNEREMVGSSSLMSHISVVCVSSLSHTHTHTHSHTLFLSISLSMPPFLSPFPFISLSIPICPSLSFSFSFSLSLFSSPFFFFLSLSVSTFHSTPDGLHIGREDNPVLASPHYHTKFMYGGKKDGIKSEYFHTFLNFIFLPSKKFFWKKQICPNNSNIHWKCSYIIWWFQMKMSFDWKKNFWNLISRKRFEILVKAPRVCNLTHLFATSFRPFQKSMKWQLQLYYVFSNST